MKVAGITARIRRLLGLSRDLRSTEFKLQIDHLINYPTEVWNAAGEMSTSQQSPDEVGLLMLKWAVLHGLCQQTSELSGVSRAAVSLRCTVWKKEISGYRKWVCRNHTFKLLPLWDFAEVIIASDKLFGTKPIRLSLHFLPHVCLLICLHSVPSLPGICVDLFGLELQGDAQVITTTQIARLWQKTKQKQPIFKHFYAFEQIP